MSEQPQASPREESSGIVLKVSFSRLMVRKFVYVYLYIRFHCLSMIIVDFAFSRPYKETMNERKPFTTSLNVMILKDIKKLAIDLDRGANDLIEEAMKDLLKKYNKKKDE